MRRTLIIIVFVFLFFLIEFFLFNVIGRFSKPNLLLLLVIFFNLCWGIRYSLLTAVFAGILKDSFTIGFFGINLFSFVLCAYATTLLKRYVYHMGFHSSRLFLIFLIIVFDIMIHACLHMMFVEVHLIQVLRYVLIPEVLTTFIVATFTFQQLKKCVLRLSV